MAISNISLTPLGYAFTSSWKPYENYSFVDPIEMCGSGQPLHGESKVVLQFDVSNAIATSKINSAFINFNLKFLWDSSQNIDYDSTGFIPMYYSSAITSGYIFGSVTHSNYSSLVTQGLKNKQDKVQAGYLTYRSNNIDVTSIVANNITNNILTIILEGFTGAQACTIEANSISLALNYEEVDPVTPLVISPNGTYENRSNQIKFEWIYKSQTEATQALAILEYRNGTSGAYTPITVTGSDNFYVMPSNRLNEGVCEWRVRTTDTDGKTSEYAYGSFTVIDRPSVPIVTAIDNKCISTIRWSSADQIAFEIEIYKDDILEYSKKVSSPDNNYKPNMFFANTTYTVRLRVCNIYGLWSEWGSKIHTFTFTNPVKPSIIVSPRNHEVLIKSNTIGAMVYKSENNSDFIPIGKVSDNGTYTDYYVASDCKYKYFVRNYADGYTDSNKQVAQVEFKGAILQNDLGYVQLRLSESIFMGYNKTITTEKVLNKFSGRSYAVAEFGEYREKTITLLIALLVDDLSKLEDLYYSNQVLVYRDFRGNKFFCVIDTISQSQITNRYYTCNLTLYQVDGTEEINVYE